MLIATDVHYDEATMTAWAAGVAFDAWTASSAVDEWTHVTRPIAPYVPGQFYLRELPCLLPLLTGAFETHPIRVVIVDGYVDLGSKPGLGRHLYDALRRQGWAAEVVGVAKSPFESASHQAVVRGSSSRPLYVTSTAPDPRPHAEQVRLMAGDTRIPSLLRYTDQLARRAGSP